MRVKRLVVPLLLLAAGGGAYYYYNRPLTEIVLTGVVTTNDVVVGPQIGGRIERLLVNEGDVVKRDQLIAVIAPGELQAESAYATHNVESVSSQIQQAQAALRYEELQMTERVHQAESNLAATEAQQAAATADLESSRLNFERTQSLSREGVAAAQQLDEARTRFEGDRMRVEALRRQSDSLRAAIALARSSAEQVAVRKGQVQSNQHMQEAAAAQQRLEDSAQFGKIVLEV